MNDLPFLRACRRESTSHTPIWLMRQAGRYQPEYRALRAKHSFLDLCRNSELAAEVTLLPVSQLGVDAAILFADILLVLEPLGVGFHFSKDDGPVIEKPIRSVADIDAVVSDLDVKATLGYVLRTVELVKEGLGGKTPLIGFAGAPFTLASYAIEGGGSKNYHRTKELMYSDEGAWNALMSKLSLAIARYLNAQIEAGADAVQLFDSWVGALSPSDYERYVAPHVKSIFDALPKGVPAINFLTGNPSLVPLQRKTGGTVIGVDWRVDLAEASRIVGPEVALMGNLDPASLLAPNEALFARAQAVLDSAKSHKGHIFNLGHGLFPEVEVAKVRALVDYVHEASCRG